MRNHNIILLFTSLLLYCSCDSKQVLIINKPFYNNDLQEEVANEVISLWLQINCQEKTKYINTPTVVSLESIVIPTVKSNQQCYPIAYVVKLDNNGSALVKIQNGQPIVIAITDTGCFDSNKFFNSDCLFENKEEKILYNLLEECLFFNVCNNSSDKEEIIRNNGESNSVWYTDTIVHPIVHTKWDQAYPFNMCMPYVPSTAIGFGPLSGYRGRHAVGCVITAAMQIMVASEHPYSINANGQSYDLYPFKEVSDYNNYELFICNTYDTLVPQYLQTKTQQLAYLLRYSNDFIGASYNPSGSTGASVLSVMNYMAYLDQQRYGNFDFHTKPQGNLSGTPEVYPMINQGKPLIIEGFQYFPNYTIGHAWIIDGYLKQHLWDYDNELHTRKFVHFNWGWHGKYDGYYRNTAINQRYIRDSVYDTNNALTTYVNLNFNVNTRYWTY